MNEKKLISKSETIGVPDIRRLMELAQELNKILTPTEYLAIVNVYNSAINRLLRENRLERGRMNDLISRKALLNDFRKTITEQSDTIDWLNMINRQETAYDVDKVVEELEEIINNLECNLIGDCENDILNAVKRGSKDE